MAEEGGLVRIEAESEVVQRDVVDVGGELFAAEPGIGLKVADGGQGMIIGDEVVRFGFVLKLDVLLDGAEVVAQVQLSRGLHAAEDAFASVARCPLPVDHG